MVNKIKVRHGTSLLIIIVIGMIYYLFNPANFSIFPKCPFLLVTGFKCPGCGSQRAIHSLLHFNLTEACKYNILLLLSLPYIVTLTYYELTKVKHRRLYSLLHKPILVWGYIFVVNIWWIIRNILNL